MQTTTTAPAPYPTHPAERPPDGTLDRLHNAPCPYCCGEGTVEGYEVTCDPDVLEPHVVVEPCPHCRGTGFTGDAWEVAA